MTGHKHFRFLAVFVALGLSLGLFACGGGDDAADKDDNKASTETPGDNDDGGEGREGRTSDSDDELAAKIAITAATKAEDVEFDGSDVRLIIRKGSIDDATPWIPCDVAEAILEDDENAFLVYPDGELDCSEQPGD